MSRISDLLSGIAVVRPAVIDMLIDYGRSYRRVMDQFETGEAFSNYVRTLGDEDLTDFVIGALVDNEIRDMAVHMESLINEIITRRSEMN